MSNYPYKGPYCGYTSPSADELLDENAEWRNEDSGTLKSCRLRFEVERPEWPKYWFKEEK